MSEVPKSDLRLLIETLRNDAGDYFREIARYVKEEPGESWRPRLSPDHYWQQVSDDSLQTARSIVQRAVRYSAQVAEAMRAAPLVGGEDLADLRHATKAMRASIQLRRYRFEEIEVLNDEDRILGVRPAMQSDDEPLPPLEAQVVFHDNTSTILRILAFVEASEDLSPPGAGAPANSIDAPRYRPGTAFVMMWMDPAHPELTDICDAVKETFQRFGVNAVRADDIEHDGQITQRVLNELRTSEFLFADLTGARPNVYYEVGFAHALGRRVLLYRKAGTGLHFDLAGYNCPEYANLRDLKEKLARRLESMTNRKAEGGEGDA
ncbi:nucleoside 2-deoxyribosyltransferase [Massilia agilis]|uniref:Nucleoside 2-deoxyribosyltransferase n=1 Tax=Massilia agilis TaxID=1811226 RepID=A0ABT2DFT7_9BURK|nr:nucleoside 2-deoxyribosyltransferase [Massilia agilis]MCS0810192.1 nucleoside 2-deoxyribosyltransferase [Massilia agilis]